jgi:hypothetical protein
MQLPFDQLSDKARAADTFTDFPNSLMSVGTTSDDRAISIFDKHGVTVHKEEDVLITCKGMPVLIGVRDEHGCYTESLSLNNAAVGNRDNPRNALQKNRARPIAYMICHL